MALDRVNDMLEGATQSVRVGTVYGEAPEVRTKTVIPVARVMYGGGLLGRVDS